MRHILKRKKNISEQKYSFMNDKNHINYNRSYLPRQNQNLRDMHYYNGNKNFIFRIFTGQNTKKFGFFRDIPAVNVF